MKSFYKRRGIRYKYKLIANRGEACFMTKRSGKLRVARRSPKIYYANLRILEKKNSYEQNQAFDFEPHQRMLNQDTRMNNEYEDKKE